MNTSISEQMNSSNSSHTTFSNFSLAFSIDLSRYSLTNSQEFPFNHDFHGFGSQTKLTFMQGLNAPANFSRCLPSMSTYPVFSSQINTESKHFSHSLITNQSINNDFKPHYQQTACPRKKIFTIIREPIIAGCKINDDNIDSINDEVISVDSPRKYSTYTNEQKREILNYCEKYGMDRTIDAYSELDPRLSRRKIKLWKENFGKIKNLKGKKTNDPARDNALMEWYHEYKAENGKLPNRREIKQKALELSRDPCFMASKGWLDKFTKKFSVDIAPIKFRISKRVSEASTRSTRDANSRKCSIESAIKEDELSSLLPTSRRLKLHSRENRLTEASNLGPNYDIHINSYFNFDDDHTSCVDKDDEIPSLQNK